MNRTLEALTLLTRALTEANVAIPVVTGLITGIAAMFRSVTGDGPTLAQVADMLEAQIAANDAAGKAEIARLKALL